VAIKNYPSYQKLLDKTTSAALYQKTMFHSPGVLFSSHRFRHPNMRCAYCGIEAPMTKEHVPPRKLFPRGTVGMVTIPACASCNNGYSRYDNRFVRLMKIQSRMTNYPALPDADGQEVSCTLPVWRDSLEHCCEPLPFLSKFDQKSIRISAAKIFWGLIYYTTRCYPKQFPYSRANYLTSADIAADRSLSSFYQYMTANAPLGIIGDGVFSYRLMNVENFILGLFQIFHNNYIFGFAQVDHSQQVQAWMKLKTLQGQWTAAGSASAVVVTTTSSP